MAFPVGLVMPTWLIASPAAANVSTAINFTCNPRTRMQAVTPVSRHSVTFYQSVSAFTDLPPVSLVAFGYLVPYSVRIVPVFPSSLLQLMISVALYLLYLQSPLHFGVLL